MGFDPFAHQTRLPHDEEPHATGGEIQFLLNVPSKAIPLKQISDDPSPT